MSEIDGPFYTWLAAQPAFVEVALGVVFVTLVAPGILAAVATALLQLERWFCARWEHRASTFSRLAHPLRIAHRIS